MEPACMSLRSLFHALILSLTALVNPASSTQDIEVEEPIVTAPMYSYSHKDRVKVLALSADGRLIATESLDGMRISDLRTGKPLRTWMERGFCANSLMFSPDGGILGTGNSDGHVRLWDAQTGDLVKTFPIGRWSIYAIAFSPDRAVLAACAGDGTVQLWDTGSGKHLITVGRQGERMSSIAFSPDGKLVATLSRYARADVWQVGSGRLIGSLTGKGADECSVSFCPLGTKLAVACPTDVYLWDPRASDKPRTVHLPDLIDPMKLLPGQTASRPIFLGMTVVSSDCRRAATVKADGSIAVWEIETRRVRQTLTGSHTADLAGGGIEAMAFSADGKFLASTNINGHVQVWQISSNR